ncbi:Zinc-binding alcohol dehydrogenase domain-containing protein cipB [Apiospora kogelbergensis]|uniref:Zinc-binding alcohol dehydrogenase domain-containing protein cipB n=1 Tax=Apiospora kogelbergensis TaxID=1337665 RepID=UPI00312FB6AD
MENNRAALILAADNSPLQVGPGHDQSSPAADEVVIKVAAVAINPSEWKMKEFSYIPLKYPHVLGSDVAGTVVKVGEEVKRFKAGDRVIGHCLGLVYGGAKHGGFQNFTTLREAVTAPIPDAASFQEAVVLPLGISTAAAGLFDDLKLRLPSANVNDDKPRDEAVLVWGAASSMGSIAVQLAVAAGYSVITTASAKNQDYARALTGGKHIAAFDYQSPSVVGDIVDHIRSAKGVKLVGAYDCVGFKSSTRACAEVLHELNGGGVLPSVLVPPEASSLPAGIKAHIVNAAAPGMVAGSPGAAVWREYVPRALANGSLRMRPEPEIVGTGLDRIEEALNLHKAGVSAKKLVVLL